MAVSGRCATMPQAQRGGMHLTTIRKTALHPLLAPQPWSAPHGSPNTRAPQAPRPATPLPPRPSNTGCTARSRPTARHHCLHMSPGTSTPDTFALKSKHPPPKHTLHTSPVAPCRSATQPTLPPARPNLHLPFPHHSNLYSGTPLRTPCRACGRRTRCAATTRSPRSRRCCGWRCSCGRTLCCWGETCSTRTSPAGQRWWAS